MVAALAHVNRPYFQIIKEERKFDSPVKRKTYMDVKNMRSCIPSEFFFIRTVTFDCDLQTPIVCTPYTTLYRLSRT